MPLWVSAYFAGYLAFGILVVARELRLHSEPRWYLAAQLLCESCLIGCALAHWLDNAPLLPAELRAALYSLGIAIALGGGVREFRKELLLDAELSPREKWGIGAMVLGVVLIVTAPLLYWGYCWAILGTLASAL